MSLYSRIQECSVTEYHSDFNGKMTNMWPLHILDQKKLKMLVKHSCIFLPLIFSYTYMTEYWTLAFP